MNFFNPLGFLALLGVPVIIIMYLLKQKYKETIVPSLFLWKQAIVQTQSHKPWQKLRKNLLMLIQIVAVVLLAFALSNPYLIGGSENQNYILVLDQSMSMQAKDENSSRFDEAKNSIKEFINHATPNTGISIIAMGETSYIAINNTYDKKAAISKLNDIKVTNGGVDIDSTITLIEMQKDQTKGNVTVFTDKNYEFTGLNVQSVLFGNRTDNAAVTLVSHTKNGENLTALVKVENFGNESVKKTVTLYCDNVVFDLKEITLEKGETKDIYFAGINKDVKMLMGRITPSDILEPDDTFYDTINNESMKKVLLISEQNIFVEKILSILSNIELYKGNINDLEGLEGYSLYVFDGVLPEELPTDGHILVFNPPKGNSLISTGDEVQVGKIETGNATLLQSLIDTDFAVSKSKKMEVPKWGEVILKTEETPIVIAGEINNQKITIFGFDLHNSELPLLKEFPIFIYNIINWYFPQNIHDIEKATAGVPISFEISPESKIITVINAQGKRVILAPPFPIETFDDTNDVGIYTLEQEDGTGIISSNYFAINVKTEGESDLKKTDTEETQNETMTGISGNRSLDGIFIIALLLLIGVEWWVNCHAN